MHAPPRWIKVTTHDGMRMIPPEGPGEGEVIVRQRQRPLRRATTLVRGLAPDLATSPAR